MENKIMCYEDFCETLLKAGFSMGGGNDEGIFSVIAWSWNDEPPYNTPIRWHTGDNDTDPWQWRMRVLEERSDISYGKVFFKKSGYITKDWAHLFLAARRGNASFYDEYEKGTMSHFSKRIFEAVEEYESLPLHEIKQICGFHKDDKSKFEKALAELQMHLFLTMAGQQNKISAKGQEYGWSSTVFSTTERFWGEEVFKKAAEITKDEAVEKISQQIRKINPNANEKKILKFINY